MKNEKLRVLMLLFALFAVTASTVGCSYAGVSTTRDGYVVIPRNNMLLYGALREVYVCKVTTGGLTECNKGVSP